MNLFKSALPKAAMFFLIFTVLCGVLYTALVTGVAQAVFPNQANGNILEVDGRRFSLTQGQQFTGDQYLWGRVMDVDVETFRDEDGNILMYSWPSNINPAGEEMDELVAARVAHIRARNPEMGDTPIPVDLVTNSGSGLDPHISPAAAEYQVARIARVRELSEDEVRAVISESTEGRFLGIFGEERVNVLEVNLRLDGIID